MRSIRKKDLIPPKTLDAGDLAATGVIFKNAFVGLKGHQSRLPERQDSAPLCPGGWRHVRCSRLLVADFVPSAPYDLPAWSKHGGDKGSSKGSSPDSSLGSKHDQSVLLRFINKPADGGITALHMAALNEYFDYVQLLIDLGANVSAVTFHYG